MDFERAKIKALFYDYPVEHAVDVTRKGNEGYLNVFSQIARWREQAFSISEMEALKRQIASNCEKDNAENLLKILVEESSKFLTMSEKEQPLVKYDNLLRWQDIVSFVGEDLLVMPFVAQDDYKKEKHNTSFLWPDVLPHNEVKINDILKQGLTDVHAHYHASVDIFHLNWIAMMNETELSKLVEIERSKLKVYQEQAIRIVNDKCTSIPIYSMVNMVVAAAYIRAKLWKMLNGYENAPDLSIETIERILNDKVDAEYTYVRELSDEYANLNLSAFRDNHGHVLDYLICAETIQAKDMDNIWTIYNGERSFIYQVFYTLLENPDSIRPYTSMVYLYLLIKGHIRSLFVQNNPLVGFENFQLYQKWKLAAIKHSPIWDHYAQFVLQTTIRPKTSDHIEGRIRVWDNSDMSFEESFIKEFNGCNKGLVSRKKVSTINKLSVVYHFIKNADLKENVMENIARQANYRKKIQKECENVIALYKKQRAPYHQPFMMVPKLTGIDAAGNELYCRPEVFAHAFRYCKKWGIKNQTYHVGEDFLDLIDGLRAVDEAVRFLEFDKRCRIGHALAIGTDVTKYYESRHFHSLVPRQNHLDNCIWLYQMGIKWGGKTMTKKLQKWLQDAAKKVYEEVGYNKVLPFDINTYWHSMLLRGTDIDFIWEPLLLCNSKWRQTACQHSKEIQQALNNKDSVTLYEMYHRKRSIKEKGAEVSDVKWELGIERVVKKVQEQMIHMIADKKIAIECNPTSNYKIGRFGRYDELPLFQFHPIRTKGAIPPINISINTDDRGVFSTSLEREFSLVSLALRKHPFVGRRYSESEITTFIDEIRKNGEKQCFK